MVIKDLAGHFRQAQSITLILGAGASVTAGIPTARQLVAILNRDYAHCLSALSDAERQDYGKVMGALSPGNRKALIQPLLDNSKLNWGHLALACVVKATRVRRILSFNFDFLVERATALLGQHMPVYDFGIAPTHQLGGLATPALFHLHGQSYGLRLLNSEEETRRHAHALAPLLRDSLRNDLTVVCGYSGEADATFPHLVEAFESQQNLIWLGRDTEPRGHLAPLFAKEYAIYSGDRDFDQTMIELAKLLGCWPPPLISNPPGHVLEVLKDLPEYPVYKDETEDLITITRDRLTKAADAWLSEQTPDEKAASAFIAGTPQPLPQPGEDESPMAKELRGWALIIEAKSLRDEALTLSGPKRSEKFKEAYAHYAAALTIKPDYHDALYSWGNALFEEAKGLEGEARAAKLRDAGEKYAGTLRIKPDYHDALYNWGNALIDEAQGLVGEARATKFRVAGEKYAAALTIKPGYLDALCNWGNALYGEALALGGEARLAKFRQAGEKYAAALRFKPDDHDALCTWGNALSDEAEGFEGETRAAKFREAGEKYAAALAIKPDKHEAFNHWGNALSAEAWGLKGGARATKLLDAGEKYAAALTIKPDDHVALNNWGNALAAEAKGLEGAARAAKYREAGEQYAAALTINPTDHDALNNWGAALSDEAEGLAGAARAAKLREAKEKTLRARELSGKASYNLACVYTLRGETGQALDELEACARDGELPDAEHLTSDTDMDSLREEPRFRALLAARG